MTTIFKASESPDLGHIEAYDYALPDALVAAHPVERRDASRLLVARRRDGALFHERFDGLGAYLQAGDLLVFNNTRVIPGRILTRKETGGRVELLVLDVLAPAGPGRWTEASAAAAGAPLEVVFECMTRTSKPLREGMALRALADPEQVFEVLECEPGRARVRTHTTANVLALLERCGELPLPPYIVSKRRTEGMEATEGSDRERYQTVYARSPGAIAAPTAGLHFTDALLARLERAGVERAFLTLKVGPGTFKPVTAERLADHAMHTEEYEIDAALADALARTRARGGRVIAVGTTTARALEAEARRERPFEPGLRSTDIFLHPGARFEVCDGLITNFHLPRSTLLALVAGFAGYGLMRRIYEEAITNHYRFYSYGDSSFIY